MNVVKEIKRINEAEARLGAKRSWHDQYKNSAYVFIGGLPFGLTEGDIITVFSQYGEVVDVNLVRDKGTGKPKGFCFLAYEDQRSTVLAVDNLNGIKLIDRTIRVDHCSDYKHIDSDEEEEKKKKRKEEDERRGGSRQYREPDMKSYRGDRDGGRGGDRGGDRGRGPRP